MKIFLLAFLFTNIIAQDFDYKNISDVFPSDELSFKENQKYYNTFKKQLITLTANNQTDENWFMLSQFIIDFSEDFESDMENASEIINKALDVVLEGVTIGDVQNNPSYFSRHMYLMKRFINYLEHTIYEESGRISLSNTFLNLKELPFSLIKLDL